MGYWDLRILYSFHIHTHSPAIHTLQVADPPEALTEALFSLNQPILTVDSDKYKKKYFLQSSVATNPIFRNSAKGTTDVNQRRSFATEFSTYSVNYLGKIRRRNQYAINCFISFFEPYLSPLALKNLENFITLVIIMHGSPKT